MIRYHFIFVFIIGVIVQICVFAKSRARLCLDMHLNRAYEQIHIVLIATGAKYTKRSVIGLHWSIIFVLRTVVTVRTIVCFSSLNVRYVCTAPNRISTVPTQKRFYLTIINSTQPHLRVQEKTYFLVIFGLIFE